MASLKDIRRRIGSVKNTQQITKAMKMVAAAKLRRAQDLISGARPFADKIGELTARIVQEMQSQKHDYKAKIIHPLLRQTPVERNDNGRPQAYMVAISSDKGLCGAYNTNVIKMAIRHYALLSQQYELRVICVGRRVGDALKKRGIKVEPVPDFWSAPLSQNRVSQLTQPWVGDFAEGRVDRIDFVYTEFRSAISQTARTRQILPLDATATSTPETSANKSAEPMVATTISQSGGEKAYLFKPGRERLLAGLLPKQVVLQMYRCFADAQASEFGARMSSMDNATRNASDMISDLTLLANRVRQASITTELMEIVGGAEALKG